MEFRFQAEVYDHLQWALFKVQSTEITLIEKPDKTEDQLLLLKHLVEIQTDLQKLFNKYDYWFEDPNLYQEHLPF